MTDMKKQARRGFCFFLMCVMLFTSYAFLGTGLSASAVVESVGGSDSLVRTSLAEIKSVLTGLTYGEYLASHENAAKADTVIDIDIADILTEITDSRGNVVKQTTATVENVSGSDYGTDGNVAARRRQRQDHMEREHREKRDVLDRDRVLYGRHLRS